MSNVKDTTKSRIDSRGVIIDPIDYSFRDLMNLSGDLIFSYDNEFISISNF
jgi:acetyl-CoA carboxylase alpha subunit